MSVDSWKIVIRELEDSLEDSKIFFSNIDTFLCSIDADNWVLES